MPDKVYFIYRNILKLLCFYFVESKIDLNSSVNRVAKLEVIEPGTTRTVSFRVRFNCCFENDL